jgi:hypothetical protein
MEQGPRYDVVWPRGQRQTGITPLAPRLADLNSKKIAQLWDYVFRGDEVFELLEEGLRARFPTVEFVSWREFGSTHDQDERAHLAAFAARFRALGVDAVISGMAC